MRQPSFWLKITNQYVIENFDQLLKYVKNYYYDPAQDSEEGDFCQTCKYLKSVADDYSGIIRNLKLYETPEFDIPIDKVIRILAASVLAAKKLNTDDFDGLSALINLVLLYNNGITSETEREYLEIIRNCIRRCHIRRFSFSWVDLESENFMIGPFQSKLGKTEFGEAPRGECRVYENRGSLILKEGVTTLSNLNYYDFKKKKLKTELKIDLGIDVKPSNVASVGSVDDLLRLYPVICGDFKEMKPSPETVLKTYSDTETIFVRVKRVAGIKVEVETVDPGYQYETGNVFIDMEYAMISNRFFFSILREGDYLPVIRNQHPTLLFRIDKRWAGYFIEEWAQDLIESEEDVKAYFVKEFNGGTRWISESGLFLNIFNNDVTEDGMMGELERAKRENLPCIARIHSTQFDNFNCLVKGRFVGVCDDSLISEDADMPDRAYGNFVKGFLEYMEYNRPDEDADEKIEPIETDSVRMIALLTYKLALKYYHSDTFSRIQSLIISMLLYRMSEADAEADYIRQQLDYQKTIIRFAQGESPAALPVSSEVTFDSIDDVRLRKEIVRILRTYKDRTDCSRDLSVSFLRNTGLSSIPPIVRELVNASNSLIDKIDLSEINSIKKSICSHLGVADQFSNIYSESTNYGVESDFLEFKTSCVLPPDDQRTNSLLKDMDLQRWNILKAVCAFMNSLAGGELLIGVADSGFAIGLRNDIETLFREHRIQEPTSDRLRTYLKLFIDHAFITADGRVSGTAITAERIQYIIEPNKENLEIIRVKISPYPWDVVKISAPDKPDGFHDAYIRTSGASTPLSRDGVRETKLRKIKALDRDDYKTAKLLQAMDDKIVVEIKNYSGVNGVSNRKVEPYKILSNNKAFLAYDLDRKDMRLFKFSRFKDEDLRLTKEKWQFQKKHIDRDVDIFGMVETTEFPQERVQVKLCDYARNLLMEECDTTPFTEKSGENRIIPNLDTSDRKDFPWILDVKVNNFGGITRFILGLPGKTKVFSTPRLTEYISTLNQ